MDRRLRFCMITTFYPPYHFGGDAVFVRQLLNELGMRGYQVEVVHCKDAYYVQDVQGGQQSTTTYRDHPNVTVHTLENPLGFVSPLLTHQTGRPILNSRRLKTILEKRFDIIHYHNISAVYGPKVLEYEPLRSELLKET